MARRIGRARPKGRWEDESMIEAVLYGPILRTHPFLGDEVIGYAFNPHADERLCYRPEEANRILPPYGGWVFINRVIPVANPPMPAAGYWATPYPDGIDGYKDGRYSIQAQLPDGGQVRLWPYEYCILPQAEIDGALRRNELTFHPIHSKLTFQEMPEVGDLVGALRLDGLTLNEAVYELTMAGVEGAGEIRIPAPGWHEPMFELPWV